MSRRVEIAFREAAAPLFPEGTVVVVAVSGGGDSVALFHLLRRLSRSRRLTLVVAHLDHALRRGSAADRRFVEALAAEHAIPCVADRRDVRKLRRKDESPEEGARRVRRGFLMEVVGLAGAARLALGHTLDDQAETVLLRLARGSGSSGLAGMAPLGPGPIARPLLGISREEVRTWLRAKGLAWREDPSNRDVRFDRNRVRRLVLPELEKANPKAARNVVAAAERLRVDAAHLDREAAIAFATIAAALDDGGVVFEAKGLAKLPEAIAGRVARLALEAAGCDPRRVSSRHVAALRDLAGAGRGHADLPSGRKAEAGRGVVKVGG